MTQSGIGRLTAARFSSSRTGMETRTSSNKTLARRRRKPSLPALSTKWHPSLSPDGAFILYLVSEKPGADATRLMRIPVGGGPPELVLSGRKD